VVLLATVSTFLYFEQARVVKATFPDRTRQTQVFASIDVAVQSLTIFIQIFFTGRLAKRLGVTVLLAAVPLTMMLGFGMLAFVATFPVLAFVMIVRRVGEYAMVRPGREMLFSPLDQETKYKAKNFIDVPVYRGADAAVAQLERAVENAGLGAQVLALLGLLAAALWAINGWWLGRKHDTAALATDAAPASLNAPGIRPKAQGLT
jgi:AAA family ATP:ADP antiporter